MEKLLLCLLLICGGIVSPQLLSTVQNVRLIGHVEYILKFMETTMHDVEEYGWSNLKLPGFTVDVDEQVLEWHIKGRANFSNAFLVSIQKVDIVQSTVQQSWRFDNTDNTSSVFCQATLRTADVSLGYDIGFEKEDGSRHHYTGIFKHDLVQFPFAVIYNMFTEEFSATVTMNSLPGSTNKMVFAPSNIITQVLSHKDRNKENLKIKLQTVRTTVGEVLKTTMKYFDYNVTSAADGMTAWATNVFQPILLEVAKKKVPFPKICYNCPV